MYRMDVFLEKLSFYKLYFSHLFFLFGVFLIMINAGLILCALDQENTNWDLNKEGIVYRNEGSILFKEDNKVYKVGKYIIGRTISGIIFLTEIIVFVYTIYISILCI